MNWFHHLPFWFQVIVACIVALAVLVALALFVIIKLGAWE